MNLYELTKKYGEGKGEGMMWQTLAIVSESIDKAMEKPEKEKMLRLLFGKLSGGHYNEEYAKEDVAKMHYAKEDGSKHQAPYWTIPQVEEVFASVKPNIPSEYNKWDFYVTLNMIKSDNCLVIKKWFPGITPEEADKKFIELAVNWLNDEDNPYGNNKIWEYLNPSK